MSISYYNRRFACPHCLWVADNERLSRTNHKEYVKPFYVIPEEKKFQGLTVIDSHRMLYKTFNCIYGSKNGNHDIYHNYENLGSIFKGVSMFFTYLNKTYGITKVNLLINSNFKKKFGVKEHPHALVSVIEPENFFNDVPESKTIRLAENPFDNDTIFELTPDDCNKLVTSGDKFKDFLREISDGKLNINDNFYIFLTYSKIDDERVITGRISTDKIII